MNEYLANNVNHFIQMWLYSRMIEQLFNHELNDVRCTWDVQ
jgi:hypothetical protein